MTCPRGCNNRAELIPAYQELSASAIAQAAIRGNGSSLELGSVLEAAGAVPLQHKDWGRGQGRSTTPSLWACHRAPRTASSSLAQPRGCHGLCMGPVPTSWGFWGLWGATGCYGVPRLEVAPPVPWQSLCALPSSTKCALRAVSPALPCPVII